MPTATQVTTVMKSVFFVLLVAPHPGQAWVAPPTRLFSRSASRRAAAQPDGDESQFAAGKFIEQATQQAKESIENAVRTTTGDTEYKFGVR